MAELFVGSTGAAQSVLSQEIWRDCPVASILVNPNEGYRLFEDFLSFGGVVASNVGSYGRGWKSFEDTGTSITQLALSGGAIQLATPATDNLEASLEAGYGNAGSFKFTTGTGPKLWFEALVRFGQAATQNVFVGLAEKGLAVTDGLFSDANAIGDKSVLGFSILAAASSTLKAVHQKNGGGGAVYPATVQTISASTWYRLGFKCDPDDKDGKKVRFYVDGVEKTYLTSTSVATFPSGVQMTPFINIKNSAAAANTLDVDAVCVAALR